MHNKDIDSFIDYFVGEYGTNIIINSTINATAYIVDLDKRTYWYDKQIYIPNSFTINTGDVIEFNGYRYIVSSQVQINENSSVAYIKQSLFTLNFIVNGHVRNFPAYAYTDATLTSGTSNIITVVDGNYKIAIPAWTIAQYRDSTGKYLVDTNHRTIFDTYALKIIGVDRTRKGLWILECQRDSVSDNDDLINGIPDTNSITHDYVVSITQSNQTVNAGDTYQFTATATMDGQTVDNPAITWTSSNTSIATVDANGLVTTLTAGSVTITATYNSATDSRTMMVESVQPTYTYKWWFNNDSAGKQYITFSSNNYEIDMLESTSCVIGVEKWNGSTQVTNDTYVWTVNRDGATTSYLTYSTTSTTITINNVQMYDGGNPTIYVKPSGTGAQENNHITIQLNGLF